MGKVPLSLRCLFAAGLAACAIAGCGGHGNAPSGGRTVGISERDFHISAPRHVAAGHVRLTVHNRGPDDHELIVVRDAAGLPLRGDGLTVDEDAVERDTLGAIEPAQPGSVHHLNLHLARGRYELFCNMSGHFKGGMHSSLVVQ